MKTDLRPVHYEIRLFPNNTGVVWIVGKERITRTEFKSLTRITSAMRAARHKAGLAW
jgi:hypothetical protein